MKIAIDPITHLPLACELKEIWPNLSEKRKTCAYILLDFNGLFLINAFFGYKTGDQLLKHFAKLLKDSFQEGVSFPLVYRLANDSFVALVLGTASDAFKKLISFKQICATHPFIVSGETQEKVLYPSFAAVILEIEPSKIPAEEVLWAAERALIELKKVTKEGIEIVSNEWLERILKKKKNLALFLEALEKDQITFALQKIVDINTGKIFAYEVLARIKLPEGRVVPAGMFIDDLAHLGLDMVLDEEVIDKALFYKKKLGIKEKLSLNFSNKFFDQKLILFKDLVFHYKIPPRELIIELTEREDFERITSFEEKFGELKNEGFLIFLDDFGIGYSNFHLLERYPFDGIKIDGRFIKNLLTNWMDRKFVEFILEISKRLEVNVVAEFVEEEKVLEFFRKSFDSQNTIDFLAQGYLLGKPEVLELK